MQETEFLDSSEVEALTGLSYRPAQIRWLKLNGWRFIKNAEGLPIIGRVYCRQKLSGEIPTAAEKVEPNFDNVNNHLHN